MDDEDFWLGHFGEGSAFGAVLRFDAESRIAFLSARAPAGVLLSLLSDKDDDSILEILRAEAAFDSMVAGWGESGTESGDTGPTGTPDDSAN